MFKRIISLSLSLLLLLTTFVSCTNTDDHAKETDPTPNTSATEDTSTPEETESFETHTEKKETPIMTPEAAEYTEYLSTVEYLDFELTGNTSPYFMGRWYQRKLLTLPHMFTVTDGSMLYFLIDGAESFDVVFTDMQMQFYTPYFAYSIDGGEPVRQIITDTKVTLPDAGKHTVRIITDAMDESEGKWQFAKGFALKEIIPSEGGKILGIKPKNKIIFFYGDSITEGIAALEASERGNSATHSYTWYCSEKLGVVPYFVGYGGTGITRTGSFNTFINTIDYNAARKPVEDGIVPDVIVINHGTNDYGRATDEEFTSGLRTALDRMCEKFPNIPMVYMIPFSQRNAKNIKSVVKDYENIHLVETDTWNVSYSDGIHPNAKGAKNAGERLADALVSIFGKDFFD